MSNSAPRLPPPRLGRGLAALLGDAAPSPAARTSLPLAALEPGPFQPRATMEAEPLEDLAASIRQQGVLQPILARAKPDAPGRYQIIAGERRWRAAALAGLHEIPVLLRTLSDTEAMAAAIVENLQRQDLDAIDEAEGYRRLLDEFGITQDQLGTLVGKSRTHVTNTVRLLQLPPEVRTHVQQGRLTAGHARALLPHPDPAAAARTVIARGLNVRQTEALLARKPPRAKAEPDAERDALERDLSTALGLRVRLTPEGPGGTLQITYRTLDQLDTLIDRIKR